jgi:hypothetical protein
MPNPATCDILLIMQEQSPKGGDQGKMMCSEQLEYISATKRVMLFDVMQRQ